MKLKLSPEQTDQIRPLMQPGRAVLGRIAFRVFDGDVSRCGEMEIEVGHVPEVSLPALREAIRAANEPPKKQTRKARQS